MELNDYFYFVHVVEKRGFSAAGRVLGIPKSRLSRHVANLEERLDVRLIQRTSRQFQVTDAGQALYKHARNALDEIDAANSAVKKQTKSLSGKVRISCSVGMAQFALCRIVTDFLHENPQVEIVQQVTNTAVDLIEAGVDMAVRAHTGDLPDSTLIQRKLTPAMWGLFASPAYLEKSGEPKSPKELNGHVGLKLGWKPEEGIWNLKGADNVSVSIPYQARICSDDMVTLKNAATSGLGVVGLPAYICREDVRLNSLVRVLPNWSAGDAWISLLMPSRKGVMPAVSAFADFIRTRLPVLVNAK